MNKPFLFTLLILIIATGCKPKTDNQVESNNYESLDYIKDLRFLLTRNEILNMLPKDKKMFSESEDGFLYEFNTDKIKHQVTALFYGEEFFSTLNATLIFSEKNNQQEAIFQYLNKTLENKYKKPADYHKSDLEEKITWLEETMDKDANYSISLSKFEDTIAVSFNIIQKQAEDFENEDENGEWVQRGENGDWIFVPN